MNNAAISETTVTSYILATFPAVETTMDYGYTFFFYRTERKLAFATLAASDNDYDHVSNLDRPGVFRLNIGVSKQTFEDLFGTEDVDLSRYDFAALDVVMPHPDYAAYHFLCVLSPSAATWPQVRTLLAEAYELAAHRFARQHNSA